MLTIILSSVLVFFIAASIILSIVYANITSGEGEKDPLDIREELGESTYAGMPIAYERLEELEMLRLIVQNSTGQFDLTRYPDDNGVFWLGYGDNYDSYTPPIFFEEGSFDYESLYAINEDDGYGRMYLISYLCSAVGTVYFQERIDLPVINETDSDEVKAEKETRRKELLREYGLDEGFTRVSFLYGERDAEGEIISRGQHHVEIGDRALNGQGYYYRVDRRDCIYYTSFDSFDYALKGFHEFIKGTLIAEGLPEDGTFEPLLTTDFKEWINTVHKDGAVEEGSNVIVKGNAITPIKESAKFSPADYPDGYEHFDNSEMSFDLGKLKGSDGYERILDALLGATVGDKSDNPIYITLLGELYESNDMLVEIPEGGSVRYTYEITEIESILDYDNGNGKKHEISDTGTTVGASSLIRVKYDYYIGAQKQNTVARHAVLDLGSSVLPDGAEASLRALSVGVLASPLTFEIDYTAENSLKSVEELIVTNIVGIFNPDGSAADTVGADSYVSVRYHEKIDGNRGETKSLTVNMSDIGESTKWGSLYDVLMGRERGSNLSLVAYSKTFHYELMREFTTHIINEIEYFVTSELVVSFRFQNSSERDPFFGASLYENTLSGKNSLYGLNADTCQRVLMVLGGLAEDTSKSSGLAGKTVAVGLTHSVMKKYNLYDYTIYFELPRGIFDATENGDSESAGGSDFAWHDTLGFTLYISKPDPVTGKRYVGSDMYNLVAEIDASAFEFLDYSFTEFWARRHLVLVDAGDIELFELDFFMDDFRGGYNFEIKKKTIYSGLWNGEMVFDDEYFEGSTSQEKFYVYITQDDGTTAETELSRYLASIGATRTSVTDLYDEIMGGGEDLFLPNSIETVGVSNFMLAFQLMQMTTYQGVLTEDEQAAAFATEKLMSIKIKLNADNASPHTYVYDFYRASDRKVMVSVYKMDYEGVVATAKMSDFYLSTFAFKKMVNGYISVFNAKDVDSEIPYVK